MKTHLRVMIVVALSVSTVACNSSRRSSSRAGATAAAASSAPATTASVTTAAPSATPGASALTPATGFTTVDAPVVINGQDLTAATAAALVPDSGGAPIPLTGWSATSGVSAQATVPAGLTPGDYRLELTHGAGVARTPATFEALAPVPPSVSGLSPASGLNDRTHTVTVTGTDFVSASQVSVGSTPATQVTFVSSTELEVVLPAGLAAGAHAVVVTHAGVSSPAGGPQWTSQNLSDPDQVGAYTAGYLDERIAGASGDSPSVRVYYPALQAGANGTPDSTGGPYPVVIYNHGFRPPLIHFGIGYQNNAFIGEWLASFGYVVACADMATNNNLFASGQSNSQRDADDTLAAIDHLEGVNLDPNHPLLGLIDATRVGLGGHSRGGDGALLAASQELLARGATSRVRAVVALGPPSNTRGAPLSFGNFAALPLLLIGASRDAIAPPRDQADILAQAGTPSMLIEIEGGNHSQYKDSDRRIRGDGTATLSLGDQHAVVRRYVTAWFGAHVRGQQTLFADYVMRGAQVVADARLRSVDIR